jgi:hypothetical protein
LWCVTDATLVTVASLRRVDAIALFARLFVSSRVELNQKTSSSSGSSYQADEWLQSPGPPFHIPLSALASSQPGFKPFYTLEPFNFSKLFYYIEYGSESRTSTSILVSYLMTRGANICHDQLPARRTLAQRIKGDENAITRHFRSASHGVTARFTAKEVITTKTAITTTTTATTTRQALGEVATNIIKNVRSALLHCLR